jgi:hypothetical protein
MQVVLQDGSRSLVDLVLDSTNSAAAGDFAGYPLGSVNVCELMSTGDGVGVVMR